MLALQLVRPRCFETVTAPDPSPPGPGWIVVRLAGALICGSDIAAFNGCMPGLSFPLSPGRHIHECAGVVTHSASTRFRCGERVVAMPDRGCGLAESFLSHQSVAVRIPQAIEDPAVAALIQPLSTLVFAVEKLGDVTGREILILGAGPIGLFAAWLLRRGGAAQIRVVDPVPARCKAALGFGATAFLTATSSEVRALQRSRLTGWPLADIVVEAVGHQPGTLNDAIALARSGGRLLALGIPDQPVYAMDYERLFRKNLHLIASVAPQWEIYLAKAADLLYRAQSELKPLITHRLGMGEATAAYALVEQKGDGVLKVLLEASGWAVAGRVGQV